jgi:hypothetical protein
VRDRLKAEEQLFLKAHGLPLSAEPDPDVERLSQEEINASYARAVAGIIVLLILIPAFAYLALW